MPCLFLEVTDLYSVNFSSAMLKWSAPSFVVIRGSDTLVYGAHGLAEMDAWRPATATTVYEIGSLTKQFTSAAIMKLTVTLERAGLGHAVPRSARAPRAGVASVVGASRAHPPT